MNGKEEEEGLSQICRERMRERVAFSRGKKKERGEDHTTDGSIENI